MDRWKTGIVAAILGGVILAIVVCGLIVLVDKRPPKSTPPPKTIAAKREAVYAIWAWNSPPLGDNPEDLWFQAATNTMAATGPPNYFSRGRPVIDGHRASFTDLDGKAVTIFADHFRVERRK